MEQYEAVKPAGPAWTILASTPVSSATLVPGVSGKYLVQNLSSANIGFLGWGMTSAQAQTNAVNLAIAAGASQNCVPVNGAFPPRVFTFAPNSFFAALAPTGTAPIVITPAEGI